LIVDGSGDLLAADVDALVNPITCAGGMGKGLALAFKRRFRRTSTLIARRASAVTFSSARCS
jgi:O-acetyl-ADP-ribose deacetylase (regulator of RNase III)